MSINKGALALALCIVAIGFPTARAAEISVTITNNAPIGGTYLTPLWVGFHDGSFDTFNAGAAASAALEPLAEDGNVGPLSLSFAGSGVDGVVGGGPIAPGASATTVLNLSNDGSNDYLSFASMLLPSSDFFIGNDAPNVYSIAGILDGTFGSITVTVLSVYDAGTEVNDFGTSAGNGLFGIPGGQGGPNQGANENGVITLAQGSDYLAYLNLAGVNVAPFDFSAYASIATITVSAVPIPAALPLLMSGIVGLGFLRHRNSGQGG